MDKKTKTIIVGGAIILLIAGAAHFSTKNTAAGGGGGGGGYVSDAGGVLSEPTPTGLIDDVVSGVQSPVTKKSTMGTTSTGTPEIRTTMLGYNWSNFYYPNGQPEIQTTSTKKGSSGGSGTGKATIKEPTHRAPTLSYGGVGLGF